MNIVWFKRDLRLFDHEPFKQACLTGPVLPLYIFEPLYWTLSDTSSRHWSFIHDSLCDLEQELQGRGARLIVRVGEVLDVLRNLHQEVGPFTLYSHEETGNDWTYQRDKKVLKWCKDHSIEWRETPSHGVIRRLKTRNEWASLRTQRLERSLPVFYEGPIQVPSFLKGDPLPPKDTPLIHHLIGGKTQKGGRQEGLKTLHSFLHQRSSDYLKTLSKPGVSARHCSRLSAHIAYGTLSVREISHETQAHIETLERINTPSAQNFIKNLKAFLSRLAWRCHFVQKMEQKPDIEFHCMHKAFEGMREPFFNEDFFKAWTLGQTGYPLIDACMRSLWENGWITFRMRAMLVAFASYDLWLDWRQTAPFLARLFTDYEPGIHYSQFQMQSGVTGINAFRLYNPVKQSQTHDPEGKFIRRFVPELYDVPNPFIHEPWKMSCPPKGYPSPVVDHVEAIQKAKSQISLRIKGEDFKAESQKVYAQLGSRKRASVAKPPKKEKFKQLAFDF